MHNILTAISNLFNETKETTLLQKGNVKHGIREYNEPKYNYLTLNAMSKLEKILTSNVPIEAGQIKLIGLENIKNRLGDKWQSSIANIHEHLITITEKHISDRDVFFSKSDDEFIIVFASTSERVAKFIAAKILQELTEKFIGVSETKDIVVKTAIKEIDGKLLFEEEDLNFLLGQVNEDDLSSEKRETISNEINETYSKKDESFTYLYRPVWDVKNEVITTYLVTTGTQIEQDAHGILKPAKTSYDVLIDKYTKKSRIALDRMLLSSNVSILEELYQNNFRTVFNIPLSYETVFNIELLKAYTLRCNVIEPFLKKYIIFSLHSFPFGIPSSKLHFIAYSLKNHCNALVFHSSEFDLDIEKFANCGIKIISFDLLAQNLSSHKNWENIIPLINKLHKEKMYIALENVNTNEDISKAKEYGIDYISGDAVGGYRDTVGTMKRVGLKSLIKKKYL